MIGSGRGWLRTFWLLPAVVVGVGALVAACGNDSGGDAQFPVIDGGDEGIVGDDSSFPEGGSFVDSGVVKALVFEPPAQELTLDGVNPGTATYKLKATLSDGTIAYVQPQSLAFDRPDLATAVNGNPVNMTAAGLFAGTGKLHAIYGGAEATADLTIKIHRRDLNGVDPNIATALDAAGLAADPSVTKLRYPYDKTVFPLGLVSPLVMWDAPKANDVYRLHVEEGGYVYDAYATVPTLGQFRVDQTMWDRLTASSGGATDPMKVTLSRYDVAGATAYTSATETWTIATASLRGAIYYWTASKIGNVQAGHIARIRPGSGAQPEALYSGNADPCMGCHAVSADGTTLAASVQSAPTGDPSTYAYTNGWLNGRAWASFDLPSGTVRKQTSYQGSNLALTPDGKYTVFGGRMQAGNQATPVAGSKYMTLADTKTGTIVTASGLDGISLSAPPASNEVGLAMPAFSPDGTKLTAVEFFGSLAAMKDNVLPSSNQIVVFPFNEATTSFTATPTRLPLGTFTPHDKSGIGYPSFTPDSTSVAYHVGNHSTGCFTDAFGNCDDNVQHRGQLWFQKADGVATPIHMANADTPPVTGDQDMSVEPTFNPIPRGGYSWVVFTSMRDWGNKLTGTANNGKRRLWVAAIDATTGTTDPSHPAFYLEGQENTPNMRGFWTLAKCTDTPKPGQSDAGTVDAGPDGGAPGACQAGFECCSGFCDRGQCVDVSTIACKPIGGSCQTNVDCCNGGNGVTCQGGTCQVVIPK